MTLPLSFKTNSNENPALYLCTLSTMHGYRDVKAMLKAYNLRIPQGQQEHLAAYTSIVKTLTGQSVEYDVPVGFMYDKDRYFKSLISTTLKVCPSCLKEGNSDLEHSLITKATCAMHLLKLLSRCPHCHHKLALDKHLIHGGCSHCGYELPHVKQTVPDYQRLICEVPADSAKDVLHDLSLAAGFVLRPYDIVPSQIRNETINEWGELFEKAFLLLTDASALQKWGDAVIHAKHVYLDELGTIAVVSGILYLETRTKLDWPEIRKVRHSLEGKLSAETMSAGSAKRLTEMHDDYFISKNRRHLTNLSQHELEMYYNYRITLEGLADVLGIELSVVENLYKKKVFTPVGSANSYSKNLVDLRDVNRTVASFSDNVSNLTPLTRDALRAIQGGFKLFNAPLSQLWELAFSDSQIAKISRGVEPVSHRLYINKMGVIKFFIRSFKTDVDNKLIKSQAMELYDLTELDLRDLAMHDLLHPMPWSHRHTYYRIKHLKIMEERVFCLGRYCKLRGLHLKTTLKQLELGGIRPVLGKSFFECRYQVIRFLKFNEFVKPRHRYDAPTQFTYLLRRDPRKALLLK